MTDIEDQDYLLCLLSVFNRCVSKQRPNVGYKTYHCDHLDELNQSKLTSGLQTAFARICGIPYPG